MIKKYFLFFQFGNVAGCKFFCGSIDFAFENEEVDISAYDYDELATYSRCVKDKICISFDSLKEAKRHRFQEEERMRISDDYAENAMYEENSYLF